ncbi:MAG: hypothetical protein JNM56_30340 [Planctomycetia bacterium]|nr:hypothetical protein [Planctomycetia bacterium]
MRHRLKVLLGGLVLAASSVQAHAQQYWPNPYFQYPAPIVAPMGQSAIDHRLVQPVVVYQQPAIPTVAARAQPQAPVAVQPVRHQVPATPEMPIIAPAPAAAPTIASLAAGQPAVMTSPAPSAATMPIGTVAEPLAPAGPPAAPVAEPKNADIARAPEPSIWRVPLATSAGIAACWFPWVRAMLMCRSLTGPRLLPWTLTTGSC